MLPVYDDLRKQLCSVWVPFSMLKMEKSRCSRNFLHSNLLCIFCADVFLFMYSTSGTQSPYVLNDVLPDGGGLSMVVVANARMNEARAAADAAAPMVPNFINDALPSGGSVSMGFAEIAKMNEARAVADAAATVAPNVINYALAACGILSMGVVENDKINEAQADADAATTAAEATKNDPAAATSNVPTASATPNAPASEATVDLLAAADTSSVPAAESPGLCLRFAYSKKSLMADKGFFWHQHENIPPNVIGMFENDLMYGRCT